jgi:hypothetical protein
MKYRLWVSEKGWFRPVVGEWRVGGGESLDTTQVLKTEQRALNIE